MPQLPFPVRNGNLNDLLDVGTGVRTSDGLVISPNCSSIEHLVDKKNNRPHIMVRMVAEPESMLGRGQIFKGQNLV